MPCYMSKKHVVGGAIDLAVGVAGTGDKPSVKIQCMVICKGYQVWRSNQGEPICELSCGARSREDYKNARVGYAREMATILNCLYIKS